MDNKTFSHIFHVAETMDNRCEFLNEFASSASRSDLEGLWEAAHRSVKDIASLSRLSFRQLALKYAIPIRTLENWTAGSRIPPTYVLLLLQIAEGIYKKP